MTSVDRFKKFHVDVGKQINAAWAVPDAQSVNLGGISQSPSQSGDDVTPTNNHLNRFSKLIEVVSYESSNVNNLQGRPKDEELIGSNPILTISFRENMVGSNALEVMKYRITDPHSFG